VSTNVDGIYFDFFGTLIDSKYVLTNVWSRIAKKLGVDISYDDPRIWEGILKQSKEANRIGILAPDDLWESHKDRLNSIALTAMGVETEGASEIVREEFTQEFATGPTFRLYPGCRETLERIHDIDIKMGILSHASMDLIKIKMKRVDIFELFDIFVLSEDVGYNKSQIEIYEIALEKMNTKHPEKIIHVGDDIYLDVHMAQKIGMTPILFDPLNMHPDEDFVTINEFSELLQYIK
jgi:HAD superfamily hydrolase (TIGR01549 family)